MFFPFTNGTVRSADDLLADLTACRQLRHLTKTQRASIVEDSFAAIEKHKIYVWVAEAFELAISRYGYSCDSCGAIMEVTADLQRKAADRALDNLDGRLKLMLCKPCSNKCYSFARREFDREMRALYSPELEKIMLAFIASEIIRIESRLRRGEPPDKPNGK